MRMVFWIVAVLVIAAATLFLVGPATLWERMAGNPDMGAQTLPTLERTGKPNDALLGPEDALAIPSDAATPVFAVPPEELFETLVARVDIAEDIRWVEQDSEGLYARGITTSPLMQFPDTNHIWVVPAGESEPQNDSTLVLYSAAQLGQSDMGKNRERMDAWLALLDDVPRAQ
ncbi:MAG: DUF1499 domain-containing protein [Pseudomonadota bacterium]